MLKTFQMTLVFMCFHVILLQYSHLCSVSGGNVDRSSSLPLQFKVVNPLAGQSDVSVMFPSREVIDDTIEREEQFTEYLVRQ